MPTYQFDLESFSTIAVIAPSEAAARLALDALLTAVSRTEYAIGAARVIRPGSDPGFKGGRPADARRLLGRMLELKGGGMTNGQVALALRVSRASVQRALKWGRDAGGG